jgi:hypothetical protein
MTSTVLFSACGCLHAHEYPPLPLPTPSPPSHTFILQGYLWTLKCCHGGADMDTAAEMAKGKLDGDTVWMIFDMLQNRWGGGAPWGSKGWGVGGGSVPGEGGGEHGWGKGGWH